jgi:hypothetical protein
MEIKVHGSTEGTGAGNVSVQGESNGLDGAASPPAAASTHPPGFYKHRWQMVLAAVDTARTDPTAAWPEVERLLTDTIKYLTALPKDHPDRLAEAELVLRTVRSLQFLKQEPTQQDFLRLENQAREILTAEEFPLHRRVMDLMNAWSAALKAKDEEACSILAEKPIEELAVASPAVRMIGLNAHLHTLRALAMKSRREGEDARVKELFSEILDTAEKLPVRKIDALAPDLSQVRKTCIYALHDLLASVQDRTEHIELLCRLQAILKAHPAQSPNRFNARCLKNVKKILEAARAGDHVELPRQMQAMVAWSETTAADSGRVVASSSLNSESLEKLPSPHEHTSEKLEELLAEIITEEGTPEPLGRVRLGSVLPQNRPALGRALVRLMSMQEFPVTSRVAVTARYCLAYGKDFEPGVRVALANATLEISSPELRTLHNKTAKSLVGASYDIVKPTLLPDVELQERLKVFQRLSLYLADAIFDVRIGRLSGMGTKHLTDAIVDFGQPLLNEMTVPCARAILRAADDAAHGNGGVVRDFLPRTWPFVRTAAEVVLRIERDDSARIEYAEMLFQLAGKVARSMSTPQDRLAGRVTLDEAEQLATNCRMSSLRIVRWKSVQLAKSGDRAGADQVAQSAFDELVSPAFAKGGSMSTADRALMVSELCTAIGRAESWRGAKYFENHKRAAEVIRAAAAGLVDAETAGKLARLADWHEKRCEPPQTP